MTALCAGRHATSAHLATAEALFACVGETARVDEGLMDGVTALSASGPAYLYVVIESLAEAGDSARGLYQARRADDARGRDDGPCV